MADAHEPTLAALAAARLVIDQIHANDSADYWSDQTLDLPSGVTISFRATSNNPERVHSVLVSGDFRVETLRSAAATERYVDQADVWDLEFTSINDQAPALGARVDSCSQGGPTDQFIISPQQRPVMAVSDDAPTVASAMPNVELIGGLVDAEPFDVTGLLAEHITDLLTALRSGAHDIEDQLLLRPIDDATAMFGAPPNYLPVLGLMVDGAVLGLMHDAEELESIDPRLVLYELGMQGAWPADDRYVLPAVVHARLNSQLSSASSPKALTSLATDLGVPIREQQSDLTFSYGIKRRRPVIAPTGWRWRNDASGNGVLGPKDAWGSTSIRKPTSIDRALALATQHVTDAPAAALYCAHEALVLANRANDVQAIRSSYASMVKPLTALGRTKIARRASHLAD